MLEKIRNWFNQSAIAETLPVESRTIYLPYLTFLYMRKSVTPEDIDIIPDLLDAPSAIVTLDFYTPEMNGYIDFVVEVNPQSEDEIAQAFNHSFTGRVTVDYWKSYEFLIKNGDSLKVYRSDRGNENELYLVNITVSQTHE